MDGFTDGHVELLETFTEQAVIESRRRGVPGVQTRTSRASATRPNTRPRPVVLKVISRSTSICNPCWTRWPRPHARLCDADQALISRRYGELLLMEANEGSRLRLRSSNRRSSGGNYINPDSQTSPPRTAREGAWYIFDDVAAVPGYPEALIRLGKHRTSLGVPLLRGSEAIGLFRFRANGSSLLLIDR